MQLVSVLARIRGYEKHIISHISKLEPIGKNKCSATPIYPRNGLTIYAKKIMLASVIYLE